MMAGIMPFDGGQILFDGKDMRETRIGYVFQYYRRPSSACGRGALALVIVIVAEMFIGSTDGLGQRIVKSQMVFDMPDMYASIFAAGALGYWFNLLFIMMERRFAHWGGK